MLRFFHRAVVLEIAMISVSLNNWFERPDTVDALEDKSAWAIFIGHTLYMVATSWPGAGWTISWLQAEVLSIELLPGNSAVAFTKISEGVFQFHGLPHDCPDPLAPVFRIQCDRPPTMYNCGGMRIPRVPHPRYDPLPSDVVL